MKRTVAVLAGIAAVAGLVYLGTTLWAQQPAGYNQQPQPGGYNTQGGYSNPTASSVARTPVRLVNLYKVLKSYKKCENMIQEFKQKVSDQYNSIKGMQEQLAAKQAKLQDNTLDQGQKEALAREVKQRMREIQDWEEDAKKRLGQIQAQSITTIYREIEEVVKRVAEHQGIDLVLVYSDPTAGQQMTPENIQHKMSQHACLPMYFNPSMDITPMVIDLLNSHYPAAASAGYPSSGQTGHQ